MSFLVFPTTLILTSNMVGFECPLVQGKKEAKGKGRRKGRKVLLPSRTCQWEVKVVWNAKSVAVSGCVWGLLISLQLEEFKERTSQWEQHRKEIGKKRSLIRAPTVDNWRNQPPETTLKTWRFS